MFRKTESLSLFLRDDEGEKLLSANEGARHDDAKKFSFSNASRNFPSPFVLPLVPAQPSEASSSAAASRPHLSPSASNIGADRAGESSEDKLWPPIGLNCLK